MSNSSALSRPHEVSSFLEPTERDLPVGRLIPVEGPRGWPMKARRFIQRLLAAKAQPKPVTIEDRPERIRHLAIEVSGGSIWRLRDGRNLSQHLHSGCPLSPRIAPLKYRLTD
jgi:hypothetical protein